MKFNSLIKFLNLNIEQELQNMRDEWANDFESRTNFVGWVDGCTDFTDFHRIFTDWESKIRENPVKIREIRISINPIPIDSTKFVIEPRFLIDTNVIIYYLNDEIPKMRVILNILKK